MNIVRGWMNPLTCLRGIGLTLLATGIFCPLTAMSQSMPPRFYWKQLSGGNAVPLIVTSMTGNTNPFDPALTVTPGAEFETTLVMAGYAHIFDLFDRAAMGAVLLPMGRISGDVITAGGEPVSQSVSGFGDPMVEFTFNLIGPKAQKTIPDALRYAVWLFGDNTDYVGKTLEADPLYQIDAHLTRDFTANLWGSLDAVYYNGGKTTIDGVEGSKLDNYGFGFTLGYQINDNLGLTFGYKSTASDQAPDDLQMDVFMISLVSGWHPIIEGSKRLQSE